jgi:uncharacterized protein (TIGR03083 family)
MKASDVLAAADHERRQSAATLRAVGPNAPTLCDGWRAIDLARHLVMGARLFGLSTLVGNLPMVALAVPIPAFVPGYVNRRNRLAPWPWDDLLDRLHHPLPRSWALPGVAEWRFMEYWAHHQDVLRPNDRHVESDLAALAESLPVAVRMEVRWRRVRLAVQPDNAPGFTVGRGRLVTITGSLEDIAMWVLGRRTTTAVTVTPPAARGIEEWTM